MRRYRRTILTLLLCALATISLTAQGKQPTDSQRLAEACNRFGEHLYAELTKDGDPTCSPASIAMALHMLLPGARGNTAEEIARVLQLPKELRGKRLLAAVAGLLPANQKQLSVHNDLWLQRGTRLTADYTNLLHEQLGVRPRELDFAANANGARRAINDYVSKATNNRIRNLLQPDSVTKDTRTVLTNTVWFKAAWQHEFYAAATKQRPFTLSDGRQVQVPMMHTTAHFGYARTADWICVTLGFAKSRMQFEVLVPAPGKTLASAEATLLAGQYQKQIQFGQVELLLPRFRTSGRHSVTHALKQLGMRDAFLLNRANFSGMQDEGAFGISDVVHQTWIRVDEKGCEAAAATAVVLKVGSAIQPPQVIAIDRPFAFALRDTATGLLWFAGRVNDPRTMP